jgi:predicted dehydrogenase
VKELWREGVIGRVLNVDFEWFVDTQHGVDYFRRWHRRKENSGGLLVHKATHPEPPGHDTVGLLC